MYVLIFSLNIFFKVLITEIKKNTFFCQVFRHGDRTPVEDETYPNDPYLHDDYHPLGNAQLTVVSILSNFILYLQ